MSQQATEMFSAGREGSAMGNQSSANGPREGKPSKSRRQWSDLVEELLEEARERGDFEHLEGKGKPLALDQNPYAGDRALAYSLLKNNQLAPPEIERGKEIDADLARADALRRA